MPNIIKIPLRCLLMHKFWDISGELNRKSWYQFFMLWLMWVTGVINYPDMVLCLLRVKGALNCLNMVSPQVVSTRYYIFQRTWVHLTVSTRCCTIPGTRVQESVSVLDATVLRDKGVMICLDMVSVLDVTTVETQGCINVSTRCYTSQGSHGCNVSTLCQY